MVQENTHVIKEMLPPVSRPRSTSSATQSPPSDVDEKLFLYLSEDEEKRKINKIASDIVSFSEELAHRVTQNVVLKNFDVAKKNCY